MKRGTTEHPKFGILSMRMELDSWETIGLLESLWMFTGRFAPRGDIGRWTDEQIAKGIGWRRTTAAELVAALTAPDSCWLDAGGSARLVVHDWPQHCDDAIHMQLARAGLCFADGTIPKMNRLSEDERKEIFKRFRAHGVRMSRARRGVVPTVLPSPVPTAPEKNSRARGARDELAIWLDSEVVPRYPKHRQVQLKTALVEVRKLNPGPELRSEILDRLARWVSSHQWLDEAGKWVPGLGKFFADGWWKREPEKTNGKAGAHRPSAGADAGRYDAEHARAAEKLRRLGIGARPAAEKAVPDMPKAGSGVHVQGGLCLAVASSPGADRGS